MQDTENQEEIGEDRYSTGQKIALTIFGCVGTTVLAMPLRGLLDLANIVMLFLLTVLLIAVSLGRNAAILTSILSVLLFDVFFVPPRLSLAVNDIQYVVTFAVMLVTALITGHLAAGLKQKAREAQIRERRTKALYETARQLAGALAIQQVEEIAARFVSHQFGARIMMVLGTTMPRTDDTMLRIEPHLVNMAIESGQRVRNDGMVVNGVASMYFPLCAPMQVRGVLAVGFSEKDIDQPPDNIALLEALTSLLAIAIERLHYVEVAQSTQLTMVTERLHSSILSALSHDLRTPLTALAGLAESLFLIKPVLPQAALDTAQAMHEQAVRLTGLVGNLLDMARLNAGEVRLRREWQPLEEVIGSSIKLLGATLAAHPVRVSLADDLPLLAFDAVLLERVFCNLLENAAKYSPPETCINISACRAGSVVEVSVCDQGAGFPGSSQEDLFKLFVRGDHVFGKPGSGLGLAICRAIVEAHGGEIRAENGAECGARLCFTLPIGSPPILEEETE